MPKIVRVFKFKRLSILSGRQLSSLSLTSNSLRFDSLTIEGGREESLLTLRFRNSILVIPPIAFGTEISLLLETSNSTIFLNEQRESGRVTI